MALTTYFKADNTTALNLAPSWTASPAGPPASSVESQARWDSNVLVARSAVLGASTTWGQILVVNPGGACTIAATAGTALTLTPTSYGNVGIDMSAATQNLTISQPLTLGSSQTWTVAAGRTLTVSGVITGNAKNVTLAGSGSRNITGNNTTTWTNSTIVVSSGSQYNITSAAAGNGAGAATNVINVNSGASFFIDTATLPTSILISGTGVVGSYYSALWADTNLAADKTVTFYGTRTSFQSGITITSSRTHAAKFTGTTTNEIVLVATCPSTLSNAANDFVAGGNWIELASLGGVGQPDGRYYWFLSGDGSDTTLFGNAANNVYITGTGSFRTTAATASRTVSRNIKIDGHSAGTAADVSQSSAQRLVFTGTMNLLGTGGFAATFDSVAGGVVVFAGVLTGAGNISVGGSATIEIGSGFSQSSYTGTLLNVGSGTVRYAVGTMTAPYSAPTLATLSNVSGVSLTLSHTSYTQVGTMNFSGSNPMSLGTGTFSCAGSLAFGVAASTLIVPNNITLSPAGVLSKSGAGALQLSGNNVGVSSITWSAGDLYLNSAGSVGSLTGTFNISSASGVLDNTSGSAVTLTHGGSKTLAANFSWAGSSSLNLGTGNTTWTAIRTFTFTGAGTGTLTIPTATTTNATFTWNVGGGTAGAKQRLALNGTNASLSSGAAGQLLQVTAGYFQVNNAGGLGSNATETMWTVSSGAALEVTGSISPTSARNVTITGRGPDTDGALRSVIGTNVWNGGITVPVQSLASPTRIQVDAGTFTLAAGTHPNIGPTVSGTPLQFTALGASAVLNQPRQLTGAVSDVIVNNGGVGTVVLSVANNHTGGTTVQGGKCRVTHATATSTGTVQVDATATLESTVQSTFTTLRLGTNGSGARAILAFAA